MSFPIDEIVSIEIGVPGPPGSGVTAGEKASFVTLTAANTFTNTLIVRKTSPTALSIRNDAGTTTLVDFNTTDHDVEFSSGALLEGFSDAKVTQTWRIDSATGLAQFDSTVEALRHIGEIHYLTLPGIDGAGVAITSGIKYDFVVPYNVNVLEWTLLTEPAGTISIEFWKDSYANFPPTVADLCTGTTGTNNPRTAAANKGRSSTLTGWDISWLQDEMVRVNVASNATTTRCAILLKVQKT